MRKGETDRSLDRREGNGWALSVVAVALIAASLLPALLSMSPGTVPGTSGERVVHESRLLDSSSSLFPSPRATSNSWKNATPLPPFGDVNALTYDSKSDRVLLFVDWAWYDMFDVWAYDFNTNTWTIQTMPAVHPRFFVMPISAAYDSESDRVIVAGPGFSMWQQETWAYDFNTNTWTNMTSSSPRPYLWGGIVYDSESDRVIQLGHRYSGQNWWNETWAYDLNTNSWTNMTPAPETPIQSDLAYDSTADRVIFAGTGGTWAYDFNTNLWKRGSGPPIGGSIGYDSESDRVILYGGSSPSTTWVYDYNTDMWSNATSGSEPPPGISALWALGQMTYDSESDRIVLFGELNWAGHVETWSYDYNLKSWKVQTVTPPLFGTMAYDSESDRIIRLFAGTWAYDVNGDKWTEMNPLEEPCCGSLAYDSESDRVVFLGLGPSGDWYSDAYLQTWAYDFNTNTWTNMSPRQEPAFTTPPAIAWDAMAYDAESDRVVLFTAGGGAHQPPGMPETWVYDLNTNTWTNMTPSSGPSGRLGQAMAYDAQSDRVVLFGGGTGSVSDDICGLDYLGDTWAYDVNTNTWTNVTPASGPEERGFHAMAYDSDHDRIILYGGRSGGCSTLEDTWAYDLDTNTWTNLTPTTSTGPRYLHAMAYDSESHLTVLFGGYPGSPGPWWGSWLYTFPDTAPTSPRSLTTAAGNRQVTLMWEEPSFDGGPPLTGYRIYRFTLPEGLSIVATVGLVQTYTDTNLVNGVLYYYWVSAINAIGEGPPSSAVSATPRLMLTAPMYLQGTAGDGRVVLTWQAPTSLDGSPITGYRVYRGESLTTLSTVVTLANGLSYADTSVTNGITYYYRVSAMSGPDEGPRSSEAIATPRESTKPAIAFLSPLDGSTVAASTVTVSGTASDDTAILRVEISRDGMNWITASGTTSWSSFLNLGEGANSIYARATDTSGNTETVSIIVTVMNPVLAALSSPIVITAIVAGVAVVMGAVAMRRRRDRRWESK